MHFFAKGIVIMMQAANEVMQMRVKERPTFERLFEAKRERISFSDLMKRKREMSGSETEPMGKASKTKEVMMEPKVKAMPKRYPEEGARGEKAKGHRECEV